MANDFKANKKDLIFAIANEDDFEADIKLLRLSETGEDIATGIWAPGNIRYPMKDETSMQIALRCLLKVMSKASLNLGSTWSLSRNGQKMLSYMYTKSWDRLLRI